MHPLLARRMEQMKASEIRELLKLTEQPDMISFAGGMPDADLFPVERLAKIREQVMREQAKEALQYSVTEGYGPLREQIAERMNRLQGTAMTAKQLLVTSGSQQGLDLTGKLFLDEGDIVLCESPTYLGALNALRGYLPRFIEVETDDDGMRIEHLEKLLKQHPVKLIYVNPNFQNPTGRCWSRERRQAFMEVVQRFEVIVIEDDPYGELGFEPGERPALASMDKKGCVVYLGSFSKILCPGYRMGWLVAGHPWMERYVLSKQAVDLHTSTIGQREISVFLAQYSIDDHISRLRDTYRHRRDAMLAAMQRHMPEGVHFTKPQGGMFVWAELPEGQDARSLLKRCLPRKVAFVPGGAFYPNGGRENALRLSYSATSEAEIEEGIGRLAQVIQSE